MAKVLVSDKLAAEGIDILKTVADVDVNTGLSEDELCAIIGNYDALVIRSGTQVTAKVLESAKNLKIIGRAGVGVDNVDVPVATEKGVIVVNSPSGNTIAAAELSVAMLLALSRNIPQANMSMKEKQWQRSKFVGNEVYHKTLAVLGLGKIGREVAKRCKSFGMKVIAYDPFLPAEAAESMGISLLSMDECLAKADYITLHLPKNKDTMGLIGKEQFAMMKDGVRIINCARGGIIDDDALIEALKSGKAAGAAIDVYVSEPPDFSSELFELPNVVTTPHLGASTKEAQINVAIDVAEQIADVFSGKSARSAVNMPSVPADVLAVITPYLPLAEKMTSLAAQMVNGGPTSVKIGYYGELAGIQASHLTRAVLVGLLQPSLGDGVNFLNAVNVAKARGIEVSETRYNECKDYPSMSTVSVKTDKNECSVSGALFGSKDIRIVNIDGFAMDFAPEGSIIIAPHTDKAGIIGKVGTIIGATGINIAAMHVGRKDAGKNAIMILNLDGEVSDDIVKELAAIDGIESVKQIKL